ncbi:class I SAM-dependent methyltransferase [Snodgrassella sp. B3882]|uniref:class I SAM-dependent methyltransferase n=1 Tax=Snodgrassella sp. B3882 TaxID=2818037 RepID=UPI00226AEF16|nr:class I SAM-dependent methyltransferase [Snodgrassella sp. B3882]MCX8745175.1 class I SAM-dependent methyltransferase [Snodgrassella sp. B3882]
MTIQPNQFTSLQQQYLVKINPAEPPILTELRNETANHRKHNMSIAPEQAQLMIWLSQLIQARYYLEIGVYTGYSSTAMAMALPQDGHITACDINVTYTDIARKYWQKAGVSAKIDLYLQPALITLDHLIAQQKTGHYDLVLIDADKTPTPHYYERCLQLVRSGGIIAIDNVFLHGRVMQAEQARDSESIKILRQFNASLVHDSRIRMLTLPLGDGLTLIQKK